MSRRGAPALPRLTDLQVLGLVRSGAYRVNLETAEVVGPKGDVIKPWGVGRDRRFVRLYGFGGVRTIFVNKLVWMVGTDSLLPDGFEVHHRDFDRTNDRFGNLLALHKVDHKKMHNGFDDEEPPF